MAEVAGDGSGTALPPFDASVERTAPPPDLGAHRELRQALDGAQAWQVWFPASPEAVAALLDDYDRLAERVEALEAALEHIGATHPNNGWVMKDLATAALRAPGGVARHEQDGK